MGNDTFIGGANEDTFVFTHNTSGADHSRILDWGLNGVNGVQFLGEDIELTLFGFVLPFTVTQVDDDAVISYGTDTITVENALASVIQDFIILV